MKTLGRLLSMVALLVSPLAVRAQSVTTTLNFDDVQPGTVINTIYDAQYHVTFTGTSANPNNNGVQVIDTISLSAPNSLDTTTGAALVKFSSVFFPQGVNLFSINLLADPQGFGSTNAFLQFFDKNGISLGTLGVDETVSQPLSFAANGIQSVRLPADAYYDNLRFTGTLNVPEPSAVALLGAGILVASGLRFRLRRKSRSKV